MTFFKRKIRNNDRVDVSGVQGPGESPNGIQGTPNGPLGTRKNRHFWRQNPRLKTIGLLLNDWTKRWKTKKDIMTANKINSLVFPYISSTELHYIYVFTFNWFCYMIHFEYSGDNYMYTYVYIYFKPVLV